MKVAFLSSTTSRTGGGVSESLRLMVKALPDGVQPLVLASRNRFTKEDMDQWDGIEVRTFRVYGPKRFGFAPGLFIALMRSRADLVHVHGLWMFHNLAALLWSRITGRRYIVTPHGMLEAWILKRSPYLKYIVSLLFHDRFLRHAGAFHLLTEKERQDVARWPRIPTTVIPNYVEVTDAATRLPGWWRDDFQKLTIFLFFGRIHEKKACIELIEAWEQVCRGASDFAAANLLVFCGWVDDLPEFDERVRKAQAVHGNVLYAGPQYGDDKICCLHAADFFILPSRSEGLPMAALEALGAGTPAILTPECNLPIAFERGAAVKIGFEVDEICKTLRVAAAMADIDRKRMRQAATDLIRDNYSRDHVGKAIHGLYLSLI